MANALIATVSSKVSSFERIKFIISLQAEYLNIKIYCAGSVVPLE